MLKHISRTDWKRERLIWIAFEKNDDNDECLFGLLPKDIILEIIKFFKTDLRLDNFTRTDYHDKDNNRKGGDVDNNNNVEKADLDQLINENLIHRVIAVIEQACSKGVCKNKIVKFLSNQDEITENDIYIAYSRYYQKNVCVRMR